MRTLATRLVALWVFAAAGLFAVVLIAVTAVALSGFAISERQTIDTVAMRVPDEARIALARHGGLAAAADEIARDLVRPGVRVGVLPAAPGPPFAVASLEGDDLSVVHPASDRDARDLARPPGPPLPGERGGRLERESLPFGLDAFMRIDPRRIAVPGGRVAVFVDPRPLARTIDAFWAAMVPIGIALVVAAIVFGRYLTSLALRPLAQTTAALEHFAAGDFTPRPVTASGRDEIAGLVVAYNGAVRQVAAAFEERRAAEAQMRQFIGDAGHELRTPLTVIIGFIDVLRRRGSADAATTRIYETMLSESRRMRTLIDRLILLARMENLQFAPEPSLVDVGDLAATVVGTLRPLDEPARITLVRESDALAFVQESELHDAIRNLVENALKYAPESPVEVRVAHDAAVVSITVSDHGPGLTEDDRLHVFDRFYRGSQRGENEGFGLGLAIVKQAMLRAGGGVDVESEPGGGARFRLQLPAAVADPQAARAS